MLREDVIESTLNWLSAALMAVFFFSLKVNDVYPRSS